MKPPLTYYGGKQRMLGHILPLIPKHQLYCEPFCGGAAVFWAKPPAPIEVLNDSNRMIINFYNVLATRPDELGVMIRSTLHSRHLFDFSGIVYRFPEFFDEVRQAWSVWVQCNQGFSASIGNAWGYGRTPSATGHDTTTRRLAKKREGFELPDLMAAMKNRLSAVQLECKDALYVIQSRDSEDSFFYIDPPYPGTHQGHYKGYEMNDFDQLLDLLASIKGKFLLSNYHIELLKAAADRHGWHTRLVKQAISTAKTIAAKGEKRPTKVECLVSNYPLDF